MAITIEATYENGVLKPGQPLPFKEHEKVRVTLESKTSWVQRTAGIMGFQGTQEEADTTQSKPHKRPAVDPCENKAFAGPFEPAQGHHALRTTRSRPKTASHLRRKPTP